MTDTATTPPHDDARQPVPGWGIAWPLLGWVAGFVGALVATLPVAAVAVATGGEAGDATLGYVVASMIGMWAAYTVVMLLATNKHGTGDATADLGLRVRPLDAAIGMSMGFASSVLIGVTYLLLDRAGLVDADTVDDRARELENLAQGGSFFVLAAFVVIGAPIFEELFFRGFLQPVLVRNIGPWFGVLATGTLFGVAHFQAVQTIGLVLFGILLGALAHTTGRLGPSIATHMMFNGLTMVTLFLER